MKNQQANSPCTLYALRDTKGDITLITMQCTRSGAWIAFEGYSDKVIGKASGYGYDKHATALSQACALLLGNESIFKCGSGLYTLYKDVENVGAMIVSDKEAVFKAIT